MPSFTTINVAYIYIRKPMESSFGAVAAHVRLASPAAGTNGATFLEVGTAITLAGNPGTTSLPPAQMILTPDGKTAFIAGFSGITVQPTPP